MAHTPGPRYLIADDGCDFTAIATKQSISGELDLEHEVLGSSEWLRVNPEDLKLMAASADLFEALLEVDATIQTNDLDKYALDPLREVVKAAIAKATRGAV